MRIPNWIRPYFRRWSLPPWIALILHTILLAIDRWGTIDFLLGKLPVIGGVLNSLWDFLIASPWGAFLIPAICFISILIIGKTSKTPVEAQKAVDTLQVLITQAQMRKPTGSIFGIVSVFVPRGSAASVPFVVELEHVLFPIVGASLNVLSYPPAPIPFEPRVEVGSIVGGSLHCRLHSSSGRTLAPGAYLLSFDTSTAYPHRMHPHLSPTPEPSSPPAPPGLWPGAINP